MCLIGRDLSACDVIIPWSVDRTRILSLVTNFCLFAENVAHFFFSRRKKARKTGENLREAFHFIFFPPKCFHSHSKEREGPSQEKNRERKDEDIQNEALSLQENTG